MKKLLKVLLIVMLCFSVVGCGGNSGKDDNIVSDKVANDKLDQVCKAVNKMPSIATGGDLFVFDFEDRRFDAAYDDGNIVYIYYHFNNDSENTTTVYSTDSRMKVSKDLSEYNKWLKNIGNIKDKQFRGWIEHRINKMKDKANVATSIDKQLKDNDCYFNLLSDDPTYQYVFLNHTETGVRITFKIENGDVSDYFVILEDKENEVKYYYFPDNNMGNLDDNLGTDNFYSFDDDEIIDGYISSDELDVIKNLKEWYETILELMDLTQDDLKKGAVEFYTKKFS